MEPDMSQKGWNFGTQYPKEMAETEALQYP